MPDFDAIKSRGHQWLEVLPPSSVSRMRPDRKSAGVMRDGDCILDRKLVLRNERTPVAAKVCHECIAEIVHNATSDEGARYVRPSHSSPIRLLENFVESDRNSKRVEFLYYFLGTSEARCAQIFQTFAEGVEV